MCVAVAFQPQVGYRKSSLSPDTVSSLASLFYIVLQLSIFAMLICIIFVIIALVLYILLSYFSFLNSCGWCKVIKLIDFYIYIIIIPHAMIKSFIDCFGYGIFYVMKEFRKTNSNVWIFNLGGCTFLGLFPMCEVKFVSQLDRVNSSKN